MGDGTTAHVVVLKGETMDELEAKGFIYHLTTCGWTRKGYNKLSEVTTGEGREEMTKTTYLQYTYDDSRCVAVSDNLDYLKEIALSNAGDIHEGCYKYIVIEKTYLTLYPHAEKIAWFEWIPSECGDKYKGHYQECDEPKQYKTTCNLGIG